MGVVTASITRVSNHLKVLEVLLNHPESKDQLHSLLERLNVLDSEYKQHHFAIIDQIDDDEELGQEQEKFDQHDDHIVELTVSLK